MAMLTMTDIDLADRRVLIREDLNVPIAAGVVNSDKRIRAALPTIRKARDAGAKVMIMSHLGRPKEGEYDDALSLAPVAKSLSALLGQNVPLQRDWLDGVDMTDQNVVLCENVRFNAGEKADDEQLARRMAALCDVFVMDAFGTAHRAQASTHGIAKFAPIACAGPLLSAELQALSKALDSPARPLIAIVGGAKVSTKLTVLESLLQTVDHLIVGGGIANTFIAASGHDVGDSLFEPALVEVATKLIAMAKERGAEIPVPIDVVTAPEFSATATATVKAVDAVHPGELILDIGPKSAQRLAQKLVNAGTIVWNGPVGVFEFEPFAGGTRKIAEAIAASDAFSIAGGGDTLAAVEKFAIEDRISYISTGGGAFLEFLEGKTLPAVAMLEQRGQQ